MNLEEQLAWERRVGRLAAAAAVGSALLLLASTIFLSATIDDQPEGTRGFLVVVERQSSDFLIAGILQSLGVLLLGAALAFLYRATKFRRPQLPRLAQPLALLGPVTFALVAILRQLELTDVADLFTASGPRSEARADDLLKGGSLAVISGVGLAAALALGFALVLINLNAMRAGLLSRFMGIIGIIVGVLYVLPLGGPQVVQLFWLGALAALFLGFWPGGRGPAWETGREAPWPSAAERRGLASAESRLDAPQSNDQPAATEPSATAPDVEVPPVPARRKRKRRA